MVVAAALGVYRGALTLPGAILKYQPAVAPAGALATTSRGSPAHRYRCAEADGVTAGPLQAATELTLPAPRSQFGAGGSPLRYG